MADGLFRNAVNGSLTGGKQLVGLIGRHDLLYEGVALATFLLHHTDHLGEGLSTFLLQGSNGLLSHGLRAARLLLDLFVNGHLPENGVVFLQLHALGRVLPVLGGDVAGSAGLTRGLMLGAFQDHLYAVPFLGHRCASNPMPRAQGPQK